MRIATSFFYDTALSAMWKRQSELHRVQEQIGSGKRFLRPSEDPIAAASAYTVRTQQTYNLTVNGNIKEATHRLNLEEDSFNSILDQLQSIREMVVQAGNSALSNENRYTMATAIKENFNSVLDVANGQDGYGNSLFSGFQQAPYDNTDPSRNRAWPFIASDDPNGYKNITYSGDQGANLIRVSSTQTVVVNDNGYDAFMRLRGSVITTTAPDPTDPTKTITNTAQDVSVFEVLNRTIDVLQTPITTTAQFTQERLESLNNIDTAIAHFNLLRTNVGGKIKDLEIVNNAELDHDLAYASHLSRLEDLDFAKASTELKQNEVFLQASQQTFSRILQLSLFNYLN